MKQDSKCRWIRECASVKNVLSLYSDCEIKIISEIRCIYTFTLLFCMKQSKQYLRFFACTCMYHKDAMF